VGQPRSRQALGRRLFELAEYAQKKGWSAEELLRKEIQTRELAMRKIEAQRADKK
jgi:hypothetical protein